MGLDVAILVNGWEISQLPRYSGKAAEKIGRAIVKLCQLFEEFLRDLRASLGDLCGQKLFNAEPAKNREGR